MFFPTGYLQIDFQQENPRQVGRFRHTYGVFFCGDNPLSLLLIGHLVGRFKIGYRKWMVVHKTYGMLNMGPCLFDCFFEGAGIGEGAVWGGFD